VVKSARVGFANFSASLATLPPTCHTNTQQHDEFKKLVSQSLVSQSLVSLGVSQSLVSLVSQSRVPQMMRLYASNAEEELGGVVN
jgi:hypothetical protein